MGNRENMEDMYIVVAMVGVGILGVVGINCGIGGVG